MSAGSDPPVAGKKKKKKEKRHGAGEKNTLAESINNKQCHIVTLKHRWGFVLPVSVPSHVTTAN